MLWIQLAAAAPSFTLSFPQRQAHLVQVEATLPAQDGEAELFMATWTPGSYLIREYARHVEGLEALGSDGEPLPLTKSSKNRWTVKTGDLDTFTLRYRVYCRTMNVRANFVDSDFAILNGAPTFIVPADLEGPYAITVERPAGWDVTMSQLSPDDSDTFEAATYDLLVDSPIVVGSPVLNRFTVAGVEHVLVDFPVTEAWRSSKAVAATERIARELHAFWGQIPYDRYLYLNLLGEHRGGLEHLGSTFMITSRFATGDDDTFERWLGLVAHEQFHAWNVKRLRPAALGPFDYEGEVYTESLWIAEGFTSYYDDVLLARAGLIDQTTYLERMSKNLAKLEATPGRLEQPVSRASYDAWIKHYRSDENSVNTAISYYTKGAVVAWVLDARIRALTKNTRSLDDAMRLAYSRYSGDEGYTPAQFVAVLSEVAGADLSAFVDRLANSTEEVQLDEALEVFGLARKDAENKAPDAWLGATLSGGRVTRVLRDSPAWRAGINVDDELLAIDGDRLKGIDTALKRYSPGDQATLLLSRRDRIRELEVRLGVPPPKPGGLTIDEKAGRKAKRARASWIGEGE